MKRCTKCGEISNDFIPEKRWKSGLSSQCRNCYYCYSKSYQRSKKGLVAKMFSAQRANSKKRGHQLPTYNLEELRDWCFSQKIFHELYDSWKESSYEKALIPSCDRTDDYKGYSLSRLQLMTWGQNDRKAKDDRKSGKLTCGHLPKKPVEQCALGSK